MNQRKSKTEHFRLQRTKWDGTRYWQKFEHEHEVRTTAAKVGGRPERWDIRKGCWCLMRLESDPRD